MIRHVPHILCLISICTISGCTTWQKLYKEKLNDGTYIQLSRPANVPDYRYLSGVRGLYNVMHHEYLINIYSCDSIFKRIYSKGKVSFLILINDENPNYPVTDEDKLIFQKAILYIDPGNKCFVEFISRAKGYRVYYEGPVKKMPPIAKQFSPAVTQ